jgi:hypothetical protein
MCAPFVVGWSRTARPGVSDTIGGYRPLNPPESWLLCSSLGEGSFNRRRPRLERLRTGLFAAEGPSLDVVSRRLMLIAHRMRELTISDCASGPSLTLHSMPS